MANDHDALVERDLAGPRPPCLCAESRSSSTLDPERRPTESRAPGPPGDGISPQGTTGRLSPPSHRGRCPRPTDEGCPHYLRRSIDSARTQPCRMNGPESCGPTCAEMTLPSQTPLRRRHPSSRPGERSPQTCTSVTQTCSAREFKGSILEHMFYFVPRVVWPPPRGATRRRRICVTLGPRRRRARRRPAHLAPSRAARLTGSSLGAYRIPTRCLDLRLTRHLPGTGQRRTSRSRPGPPTSRSWREPTRTSSPRWP